MARECRAELWRRIRWNAADMSPAELRGYARAQASGLVTAEAERILDQHRVRPEVREQALAAAIQQVVNMAVRDVLSEPAPMAARTAA